MTQSKNERAWSPGDHSLITDVDSYKGSHYLQYPPDTRHVSSYVEARGGEHKRALFFGLQMYLKRYLSRPITTAEIDYGEELWTSHGLPFNRAGWEHIVREHGGMLPLRIQAVAEGTVMPIHNVVVQVENTDPAVPWLTSFIETAMLRAIWYPTTVATISWGVKQVIRRYLEDTCENPDAELPFKLHDFGARGVSSTESAGIGGLGHLVNFLGTDTLAALIQAREYYHEDMAGFSIPAAEHSTMTAWGKEGEVDAFANMVDQFGGEGKLVAVVSDSYDIYHAANHYWGEVLKDKVEEMGGTVVVRPDSGDPTIVPIKVIEILGDKFGYTLNSKGYKVLAPCVRVIQGDGVNPKSIEQILGILKDKGWSAENIAFGMGGSLLQRGVNRDTMHWAMKASAIQRGEDEAWRDIFKKPVTDDHKKSKSGRQALIRDAGGSYMTVREDELTNGAENLLEDVWRDGELLRDQTLLQIRARSERG